MVVIWIVDILKIIYCKYGLQFILEYLQGRLGGFYKSYIHLYSADGPLVFCCKNVNGML